MGSPRSPSCNGGLLLRGGREGKEGEGMKESEGKEEEGGEDDLHLILFLAPVCY